MEHKVHHHIHKALPLDPILFELNTLHPLHFISLRLILISPSNLFLHQSNYLFSSCYQPNFCISFSVGRDSVVNIMICHRPGDRTLVGARFFHTHPDQPWNPPSLLYNVYQVIPGVPLS